MTVVRQRSTTRALALGDMLVGPGERATLAGEPLTEPFRVSRVWVDTIKGNGDDVHVTSVKLHNVEQLPCGIIPIGTFQALAMGADYNTWLLPGMTASVEVVNNGREAVEIRAFAIERNRVFDRPAESP